MHYILYCAIKSERLVYDTIYSILTLYYTEKSFDKIRIVIYTDKAHLFQELIPDSIKKNIIIENIDINTVNEWTKNGYIYFVKLYTIKNFLEKYKRNVFFVDGDTYFTESILHIFQDIENRKFFLYRQYDSIALSLYNIREKYNDELSVDNGNILIGKNKKIPINYTYYLSSVIGINSEFNIIDEIIDLCNEIYIATKIPYSEEIAVAAVFQKYGEVKSVDRFIDNYSSKDYIRYFIAYSINTFLNKDKERLMEYLYLNNLDLCCLDNLKLTYNDMKYFIFLYNAFKTNPLFYKERSLYQAAVNENIIKEENDEIKLFAEFVEKFKCSFVKHNI